MANTDADIEKWLAEQEAQLGIASPRRRRAPVASPEMQAVFEAAQALPVEDARAEALQAIAGGEMPTGTPNAALINALTSMAPPATPAPAPSDKTAREPLPTPMELRRQPAGQDLELEALADLRAAQSGAQRAEALLPYLQAAQQFTAALGRTKYDPSGVQAIAAVTRAKEQDAAARLKAAQEFARRRMAEGQFERQMASREALAEREAALASEQLEIRRQAEERMLEAEARRMEAEKRRMQAEERRGRAAPKPVDEITQRKRELEVQRLEREARGEPTTAQKQKQQETMQEIDYRSKSIDENLAELEKLIEEGGTYNALGGHNQALTSRIYAIAIDTAKLVDPASVAREGEVTAAQKYALFQPSLTMRNSTALEIIKDFRKQAARRKRIAYEVRGLTEPGQEPAATPRSQFPMVVRDRQTGQRYTINSREEAERLSAIADRLDVVQ